MNWSRQLKNITADSPLDLRGYGNERLRFSGKLLARAKDSSELSGGKETSMQNDAVVEARGGVATGGVWRSGRMMITMVSLFVLAFTMAGVMPTKGDAFIGWCRKCAAAEAIPNLTGLQISLPQATQPGITEVVDVYIPSIGEYSVGMDTTTDAVEGDSPLLRVSTHSAGGTVVEASNAKAPVQRLVAPQPSLT